MTTDLRDRFTVLTQSVYQRRPLLQEITTKYADKNLYAYTSEYCDVNLNPTIEKRQAEFLDTLRAGLTAKLDASVADGVCRQLKKYYFVSTADHLGPVGHPAFWNASAVAALPLLQHPDPAAQYLVVLACSNISFNNLSFPRGLVFSSMVQQRPVLQQLTFFPRAVRPLPVYRFRSYDQAAIAKVKKQLGQLQQAGTICAQERDKLEVIIDDVYSAPDVLDCSLYADQVTKTTYRLWSKYFRAPAQGIKPPHFIYLEQESFVIQLLLDHHLFKDTTITHMLFDPAYDALIAKHFDGIMCAFSLQARTGTYLFWALPPGQKYRQQLWKQGNVLRTSDGSYQVALEPDALAAAFRAGELLPSTLFSMIILSLYYGVKLLGGFNQINYLVRMKEAYMAMQTERGNLKSVEVCRRTQTKELCDMLITFARTPSGALTPAAALDVYLYGRPDSWTTLYNIAQHLRLRQSLEPMMPAFYQMSYTEPERSADLSSLTSDQIIELQNLRTVLQPCAQLHQH